MNITEENYQLWIIKRTLSIALILSMLILIIVSNPKEYIYGLLFSTCITVLNFRLMCISIERSLYMPQKKNKIFYTGKLCHKNFYLWYCHIYFLYSRLFKFLYCYIGFVFCENNYTFWCLLQEEIV